MRTHRCNGEIDLPLPSNWNRPTESRDELLEMLEACRVVLGRPFLSAYAFGDAFATQRWILDRLDRGPVVS